MTPQRVKVVVLICNYNGESYLHDCLRSLLDSHDPGLDVRILVVDNASKDGSVALVQQHYPGVELLALPSNLGFAGGNNAGWQYIQQHHPDAAFLVLLNMDTVVQTGWLTPLVAHMQENPSVACTQPRLMLHPQTELINTLGNRSHFLGFGQMTHYRRRFEDMPALRPEIDFASGAAVMIRAEVLREIKLFDEVMFMYLEDAELGWKCRLAGYASHLVPISVVMHKYRAGTPVRSYYFLERNRWLLLLTHYKLATLVLLLPALLVMELGQVAFAAMQGVLGAKLRAWAWFLRPGNLAHVLGRRSEIQRLRKVRDREFMGGFAGKVEFETVDHPLLRYVGNPLLSTYWQVARAFLFW